MGSIKDFADQLSPILGKKSVVDGKEIEQVFLAAGGMGIGEGESADGTEPSRGAGGGGGGITVPLGAYYVDQGRLRFHPNPVVLLWSALHLVGMITGLVRAILRAKRRKARRAAKMQRRHRDG